MLGRTVLEFRIEKKLAEGGMGAVYLARHVLLSSTLKVIKVLLPEYAENTAVRLRFHREAEAASKLKHDCILGIDNFGALEHGQLFIMIPFLEGQPLDAYLRSRGGRLAPHRALHLVVQLCDALDHAHALGIVHRDLKPGNVFVVATNTNPSALKLLDFGIAKILGNQQSGLKTHSGVAIGTPSYMAVEQYEHADEVTHLADVYSLAVMIWEIVTGRLPWQHPDPAILYYQQRTVLPSRPPASEMPPEWADSLLAALSVDPAARPQSTRELAITLASALPAVGRVPSGAEILAALVPHFLREAAPGDETVRNAADVDRIVPLLWPPRELTAAPVHELPRSTVSGAPETGPPAQAPGVTAPAGAAASVNATTLSAATIVTARAGGRRFARWKLALAATVTLVVVAIMTSWFAARGFSERTSALTPAPGAIEAPELGSGAAPAPSQMATARDGGVEPSGAPQAHAGSARLERTPATQPSVKVPAPAASAPATPTLHQGARRDAAAAPPRQPVMVPPRQPAAEPLHQAGTGTLVITAVPFADVAVDGRSRGTTPLSLELPSRRYRVTLTGPNGEITTKVVDVVDAHETKVSQRW
jgi:serine/threonine-protein kinase